MDDIETLKRQIKRARSHGISVFEARANLAGFLSGVPGVVGNDIEFPEPDLMYVYQTLFDSRAGNPIVFRLSFGRQLKWVCIKHPWGLKASDIDVPEDE